MGCFDTVIFKCPKCGEELDEQTKAGKCALQTYRQNKVPVEIAVHMIGDSIECHACHTKWEVTDCIPTPKEIALHLVEPLPEDDEDDY